MVYTETDSYKVKERKNSVYGKAVSKDEGRKVIELDFDGVLVDVTFNARPKEIPARGFFGRGRLGGYNMRRAVARAADAYPGKVLSMYCYKPIRDKEKPTWRFVVVDDQI